MKSIFILCLLFLLFSCEQQNKKTKVDYTNDIDTVTEIIPIDTITKIQTEQVISPNQQELNKSLADSTIDNYYKEIYRQEKLIWTDEIKMLTIPKKLFTNNSDKDLFFFIVFTKSMNGSDGFYSEALGISAFKFVTKKTEWFTDYFNISPKLNEQDMDNWAKCVYSEIKISRESEEKKAINELENQLLKNIKEARKEYEIVIKRFIKKIKTLSELH